MRGLLSVYRREVKSYFSTPVAYVFFVIFLFFSAFLAFQEGFLQSRQATLRAFFSNMPLLFLFLVPAIAMRLWAEERRSHSIELLFTLPITTPQAVLAKFGAALTVLTLAIALTFPMVVTVCYLGDPDWGPIITGYFGCVLMSAAYLAISGFFSALSRNQVIAFILAAVVCGIFVLSGSPSVTGFVARYLGNGMAEAVEVFSFQSRFESIQRGVLELRDLAFFVLLVAGWLWATIVVLEERKAA